RSSLVPYTTLFRSIADQDRLVDATGHGIPQDVAGVPGEGHWIIARPPPASGRAAAASRSTPHRRRGWLRIIARSSSTDRPSPPPPPPRPLSTCLPSRRWPQATWPPSPP